MRVLIKTVCNTYSSSISNVEQTTTATGFHVKPVTGNVSLFTYSDFRNSRDRDSNEPPDITPPSARLTAVAPYYQQAFKRRQAYGQAFTKPVYTSSLEDPFLAGGDAAEEVERRRGEAVPQEGWPEEVHHQRGR
eukprot:1196092-Prorocentrum_minimum.AAC.6